MNLNINPKTNQPYKVLWFGDLVIPSGFGRIGNEVTTRLKYRGYDVLGVGISYDGLLPHQLPFWVSAAGGRDLWQSVTNIVGAYRPDIIISCQDFPYHDTLYNACKIDFSRLTWMWITPIDGVPIDPGWLKLCKVADAKMTISRFGVRAFRDAGYKVGLCQPGINTQEFYQVDRPEALQLRQAAGYNPDDFIVGVVCMNQGRKAIPPMIEGFFEFARDKDNAQLYLDMDKISPAGWNIPNVLQQMGLTDEQKARVKYREDLLKIEAFAPLRSRYALMDAHMVISHREGYGLPLHESMACGVPTLALDYCSGTEIVGEGRGYLVKRQDYMQHGTWGGAKDAFPDMADLVRNLDLIYCYPEQAQAVARVGRDWAVEQTWDKTADAVEREFQAALKRNRSLEPNGNTNASTTTNSADSHAASGDQTSGAQPVSGDPVLQQASDPNPLS